MFQSRQQPQAEEAARSGLERFVSAQNSGAGHGVPFATVPSRSEYKTVRSGGGRNAKILNRSVPMRHSYVSGQPGCTDIHLVDKEEI